VVHLIDTATGKKHGEIKGHLTRAEIVADKPPFEVVRSGILCLAFAPDGKTLVTGGEDGLVCVWDVAAAKVVFQYAGHRKGKDTVCVLSVAVAPDGQSIASVDDRGALPVWEVPR
jgi:WD40 repeat protein